MTITELRQNMKQALDKVDAGEQVLVTRGGKIYEIVKVA